MAKFHFRLARVLEYRELQEDWAKRGYLEAQRARLVEDAELARIHARRAQTLKHPALCVADRIALERVLLALDDVEHQQRIALQVLLQEEAQAMAAWTESRRQAEALRKLREKAMRDFEYQESWQEQAQLDEWAVLRKVDSPQKRIA